MTAWQIVPVPVPSSPDSSDAWLLRGTVDAADAALLDTWGDLDLRRTVQDALVDLREETYARSVRLAALAPGALGDPALVLGSAVVELPAGANAHTAAIDVTVRPAHRRQGIGSALHAAALGVARTHGRTTLFASTSQRQEPASGPDTLVASTGSGRVDATDPSVRFAVRHGWILGQVNRRSVLPLPADPSLLSRYRDEAQTTAGPDYRVLTWQDRCPEEWVEQFAVLSSRMSADVPVGDLDIRADAWDADRVRSDERKSAERGVTLRVAVAEHVPTGTLAAYSVLITVPHDPAVVHQGDTLVLGEHRGRRLGMLLKAAQLQRLAAEQPEARRLSTWNAEENAPMLAINVALGFRPAGGSGEWHRPLV